MTNKAIRQAAANAGVKLWQVADALGITDSTFSRRLRREFSDAEREKVLAVIDRLRREGTHND